MKWIPLALALSLALSAQADEKAVYVGEGRSQAKEPGANSQGTGAK